MFESRSRYFSIDDTRMIRNGEEIAYKKRRFIPSGEMMTLLQEVSVTEGDRLDRMTAGITGDPEQYWFICDANNAMHPLDLTDKVGRQLRIARPW